MRRLAARAAAWAIGLWICGCSGGDRLSGSVSELFPNGLGVSRVEILRNEQALQISYFQNRADDVDLLARVTISAVGVELKSGPRIDLAGEYEAGHQRTTVISLLSGEPTRFFAPVERGDLELNHGGGVGQGTSGDFSMKFQEGDGFGAGRTLVGSFTGEALDAGYDPELPDAGNR